MTKHSIDILGTVGDYRHGYVHNTADGVPSKIHFVEKGVQDATHVPVVVSPGLWESAERAIPLCDGLNRHCLAVSYRGRGRSDTPLQGYDLGHHVSDLATVIEALELPPFVLVAFSRGVGYACGYVREAPERVKGLILVDYPAIHTRPSSGYAAFWARLVYLGRPIPDFIRVEALEGIEREAQHVALWEALRAAQCPVAIFRGTDPTSAIPSNLTDEDMAHYRAAIPHCSEVTFASSGHMVVDEELGKYRQEVQKFCTEIDDNSS